MKKNLVFICLLLLLGFGFFSCKKELNKSRLTSELFIDTSIVAGSDYYLNLSPMGTEDDMAIILTKGNNTVISELENESDMFTTVYHYQSTLKSAGSTDKVVLLITGNPLLNNHCNKDSTFIYLNLTLK
ncbi:MAG: hypothetical protein RLZZ28_1466 [Bacteroidota bacterium]|jgi:hypothetical protein